MDEREQLQRAIEAQATLRGTLPDEIVDATIVALEDRLAILADAARPKRRKLITVLFADLTGSTALGESLDPEELSDRFDALWRYLDGVIDRHEGRIDKHIGDAVMALWGADHAREDDPERAIRAALEMQTVLTRLRDEGEVPALGMRIGINTGPVVLGAIASTDEFTAMGDTVNVAARLEQAAPPGGVLIGHDTYRHVRGVFDVRVQEPLVVKGKRASLRTYLVDGIQPRAFRLRTRRIEGVETSMIGRHSELARLKQALTTTIDNSTATTALVVGDAGIGKSRLLYEFEDWLRLRSGNVRLFTGRADQGRQGVPYSLIRDVLYSRFEIAEDEPSEIALAKLIVGLRALAGPDVADEAPIIGHLIGIDIDIGPSARGDAVEERQLAERGALALGRLLARAAAKVPVVLLLEDLHWADRASAELLGRVQRDVAACPILIVGLSRANPVDRPGAWDRADTWTVRIDLAPLTGIEAEQLVDEVLQKMSDIPTGPKRQIVKAAAGNPFFVEELVRMMVDEDVISITGDHWTFRADRLGELAIPPTVTGVIQARLDRLSPDELSVLQRASVVGRVFWEASIPTVETGHDGGAVDVPSTLAALVARDLIEQQDTSDFQSTTEYRFKHAILHEVTYETVLRHDRRVLHRGVAEWMAGRGDGSVTASAVAGHFSAGGAVLESAQWFARATSQARKRGAVDEAISAGRAALDPGVLDDLAKLRVFDDLCESLSIAARYDDAMAMAVTMAETAEALDDGSSLAVALMHQSHLHVRQGRNREALGNAQQAHELLVRNGAGSDELLKSVTELAWVLLRLGWAQEAVDRGLEALGLVDETTAVRSLRGVHSMLGAAYHTLGNYAEAAAHVGEALTLDRRRGDRRGEAANLINLGEVARLQGDRPRSIAVLTDALTIVREIGDRDQEALVLSNLGGTFVEVGDVDIGMTHLIAAVQLSERSGGNEHASETHRFLAEALLARGDIVQATAEARTALELAHHDENPDHLGHAWRVFGLIAAGTDQPIEVSGVGVLLEADECLSKSVSIFAAAGMERDRALALANRATIAEHAGDAASASAYLDNARSILAALGLDNLV